MSTIETPILVSEGGRRVTFFWREFGGSMNLKSKGHSAAYLKRQAKNIKKAQGISYLKALDQAAISAGFTNYKNYLNQVPGSGVPKPDTRQPLPQKPFPVVLTYRTIGRSHKDQRPNAKMPIPSHIEMATMLKELRNAAEGYKRVESPIRFVRGTLDDWIQCEYPDRNELPDEVFFRMYYGDEHNAIEYSPTQERKQQMISICNKIKNILGQHYHECQPLRELYKKLDLAAKWIDCWPADKQPKAITGIKNAIPPGTFVRLKNNKQPAIIIRHQYRTVDVYTNRGPLTAARHEVSVARNQSEALNFNPMRLFLPYGKWKCIDGTEVLFNRDYCPIWAKGANGIVASIAPDTWIKYDGEPDYYFDDTTAPWYRNKRYAEICLNVLEKWGVAKKNSMLMELLPEAIKAGDTGLLKPKNRHKEFPG